MKNTLHMNLAEMARCVDCYALLFADEMDLCPAGHWTCPQCACDCSTVTGIRTQAPAWVQKGLDMGAEPESLR